MPAPAKSPPRPARAAAVPALQEIKDVLRGPVIDVFRQSMPVLQGLTRAQAYDRIMSRPDLADECFKLFRNRPELFESFMVGPDRQPVSGEDAPLSCGRSLAEVIALLVRAIAKRHFRAKLGLRSADGEEPRPAPPSLWEHVKTLLGRPSAPARPARPRMTRADRLYQAMRDVLLYEWQVPLIPHYVPLPVPLVRQLGPRILEYRHPQQLRELMTKGPPVLTPSPAPGDAAEDGSFAEPRLAAGVPNANGSTSRAEAMWNACQELGLATLFAIDEQEMRACVAHASAVGPLAMTALNSAGLTLHGAVIFLCTIDRSLGHAALRTLLGTTASSAFLKALVAYCRARNLGEMTDPADLKAGTERLLDELRRAGHLPL